MIPPGRRALSRLFPDIPTRCYAFCKLATDPLYPAVRRALDGCRGPLLDIGCGIGLAAFHLRAHGWTGAMRGIDYDPRKIAAATAVAARVAPDMTFTTGDARTDLPPHAGSVTILDILQYFAPADQDALLDAAAARVAPGERLVIRTGLQSAGWRFAITRAVDRFAAAARWMKAPPVHYPVPEGLVARLEAAGLAGTLTPLWGRTPFNNWLAVFSRSA